ncbi:hypothetical protein IKG07_02190 [Candidatus Saccharibacteria bacterium]|nr:hypothetical protein [Candidatus Saccharibacteria bacterium]
MAMKTHMTAKDWLDSIDPVQLEKVCSLKNNPAFMEFLVTSDMGTIEAARYGADCLAVGVPNEYTSSAQSLHYLTIAIANYLNGNA